VARQGEKASHRAAEPRLDLGNADLGNAGAATVEISRQYRRPQLRRAKVEAVQHRAKEPVGSQPQPFGAVVGTLCCRAD
jgi:hypothetical protein